MYTSIQVDLRFTVTKALADLGAPAWNLPLNKVPASRVRAVNLDSRESHHTVVSDTHPLGALKGPAARNCRIGAHSTVIEKCPGQRCLYLPGQRPPLIPSSASLHGNDSGCCSSAHATGARDYQETREYPDHSMHT